MKWFKKYLSFEIGIDFKTCIYSFIVLFFYSIYRIFQGSLLASIITMGEIIASAYVIGYIQVYLLKNFDEAEQLGSQECFAVFLCSALYTVISYILNWYDRNISTTLLFFFYMIVCYLSVFLAYKIKRDIETAALNRELENFKRLKNRKDVA
ncbi:MAG: DUF3021 domain-containing protein [Lachnospiraceae bacterium]|nr:DUF3021 domain-containing protein [Lachnospiraceae bacterium]